MIRTLRYDYMPISRIELHPELPNHRRLRPAKVAHLARDIAVHGLLDPLVVWEREDGRRFLVGGFHRLAAIRRIRARHSDWFERVDVRLVSGELDEMRGLNLKLNTDRLEPDLPEFFDAIPILERAGWSAERIAEFLDMEISLVEEILLYAPLLEPRLRRMLEQERISWKRTKRTCRKILAAPDLARSRVLDAELRRAAGRKSALKEQSSKPLTIKRALRRAAQAARRPQPLAADTRDLLALLEVLRAGRRAPGPLVERARAAFPFLFERGGQSAPSQQ